MEHHRPSARIHAYRWRSAAVLLAALGVLVPVALGPTAGHASTSRFPTPIRHVVILYQENHSFNEVLGVLCKRTGRCLTASHGATATGDPIPLQQASDIVPEVAHSSTAQLTAIDDGRMDGFSEIRGCTESSGYQCYRQYRPDQIPNLSALARKYAISEATFEMNPIPSWGAHLELVAASLDGFTGDNPYASMTGVPPGPGWGCDSNRDADWQSDPTAPVESVPACVPTIQGTGPYRESPVTWVPTIMDRLRAARLRWRIYAQPPTEQQPIPYGWAICPTFAECLHTAQHNNVVLDPQVVTDAQNGTLPRLALVIPRWQKSQHNGTSMAQGDNWIGRVVGAIMHGPDWPHTAIFITYDDCGCFYDQVAPPPGLGVRVPMVIVSPYARPHYTDPTTATFASLLAFTEYVFRLSPLSSLDRNAYNFRRAFNFRQAPLGPIRLTSRTIPRWERRWIEAHAYLQDEPT